jgi:SMODS and SLOG-associating 2TM effector domain 2
MQEMPPKHAADGIGGVSDRNVFRRFSSLSFTLALLIVGTVLPILAALGKGPEGRLLFTQIGVAALAFAGLLQVSDRTFGWSSGWLRYITTVTAMEGLTRKFELEWASYILEKGSSIGAADTKVLFDLAKRFEDDVAKLQSDETSKWVTEFSSSVALLGELIKSQRESGEKTVEAARAVREKAAQESEKARKQGAVQLSIVHKAAPVAVNISIDAEAAQQFLGSSWVKANLEPGQHTVTVTTNDATPQTIQQVADVPPGGVAKVEVRLS